MDHHHHHHQRHRHHGDVELGHPQDTRRRSSRLPLMWRLKGTVILKIWWQGLFMTFYTMVIVGLHNYVDALKMNFPMTLVPILGVVTGLVLAFRTNTAYGRYWEGRQLWSRMSVQLRFLTLCIWAGSDDATCTKMVVMTTETKAEPIEEETEKLREAKEVEELIEKVSAINLLVAFAYATKNYLRGEYSYDELDMKDLISHLPKFQTPSSNQPFNTQTPYRRNSDQDENQNSDQEDSELIGLAALTLAYTSTRIGGSIAFTGTQGLVDVGLDLEGVSQQLTTGGTPKEEVVKVVNDGKIFLRRHTLKAHDYITPSNIPIEIIYNLFSYLRHLTSKGNFDATVLRYMYASLLALIECLTGFERILRTPIPLAYNVHLHCCIWLYLLSLPYQLVGTLNYWCIPAVTLATFALLGILRIGWEIENPFGYEDNDLPLDDFCKVIRREIQVILGHQLPTPRSWIMSEKNHPLAPNCWLNAQELAGKSVREIRTILAQSATTDCCPGTFPPFMNF